MSKSYRKVIREGICHGSNTEYYRTKRRYIRRKNKQQLHINPEEFEHVEKLAKFKDSWSEPTDGTRLVDWQYLKEALYNAKSSTPYCDMQEFYFNMKRFGNTLKPNKFSKILRKYKNKWAGKIYYNMKHSKLAKKNKYNINTLIK